MKTSFPLSARPDRIVISKEKLEQIHREGAQGAKRQAARIADFLQRNPDFAMKSAPKSAAAGSPNE